MNFHVSNMRGYHLFEKCSTNLVSVKYVGNNKYNNPNNNTYKPEWCNHPNFSWINTQNHLKPWVPQVPPSFFAPNYAVAKQPVGENFDVLYTRNK